nr:hypothetical protein [Tanacetum cinerariifolium]
MRTIQKIHCEFIDYVNDPKTHGVIKPRRKDTKVPQLSVPTIVANEAVNEEMYDSLEKAATTATSLDAKPDRGNISKTQSKATPNEPEVNTSQSQEDSLKLTELIELCINLQNRVLDLETIKTTQAMEIKSLKRRVKKLEKKQRSRTHKLKRLYKVGLLARVEFSKEEGLGEEDTSKLERIADIDASEDITLVSAHDEQMFDVDQYLCGEEVFITQQHEDVVEKEADSAQSQVTTTATTPTISIDEATLAQALTELKHAKPKAKAKVEDDKDTTKLKQLVNIIQDEEAVAIDAIPLTANPSSIVDWKTQKEGKKSYYKIIKANGSSKIYLIFGHMLKDFDKEDVETLWKLVKAKYGSTRLEADYERVLWGDLKVMFEPYIEYEVGKMQQRYKVLRWMLFNSCGVHCLCLQSGHIFMLVERKYPLTHVTVTDTLNKKLQTNHFDEMTYQLLKLILKQLKNE